MNVFYKRQYYHDLLEPLADSPIANVPKIIVPDHLIITLDTYANVQIIPVALTHSFVHALLYVLYPKYHALTWMEKQLAVNNFEKNTLASLNINLIVINSESYSCDIVSQEAPCVILYKDDLDIYYPMSINGNFLTSTVIDSEISKFVK